MKKKWLNFLPTIFIICIIVSLMMYSSSATSQNLNFTEFEKKAEKVEFLNSSMTIESTIIQVEGVYKSDGEKVAFKALIPNTDANIEWLDETLSKDGGEITVINPDANKIWINMIGQMVPFLVIAIVFYLMMAKMGGGSNAKAFEFAKSRARMENDVKVRFKDVAGCDEEKEEVKEIIDYLKTPKKFTDMGAHIPKGV
ncbi:MAG: cell division protein FtsH, partial [Floccifex sp.]